MSPTRARTSLSGVVGILALGPALAMLGGCHHRSSSLDQSRPADRVEARARHQSSDELLARRFPGATVLRTRTGGFLIQIQSGLVGGSQPLYLIDGAPMLVEPSRGIDWLKLEDVAQIRVLKDPAQTAVYGPRAANGVVVITTKQAASTRP